MARRPRVLFEGAIYHVTFRGVAKQAIFEDVRDRHRLVDKLAECGETYRVRLYLYCLMPNHVHLLVETPHANLDRFMGSLLTAYTVYYNKRHDRVGHLMQGRYGAQVVDGDEYLLKLSRYIHLNPVRTEYGRQQPLKERIAFLQQYRWSSYRTYIGLQSGEDWLETGPLQAMIPGARKGSLQKDYQRYVERGLAETDDEFDQLMKKHPLAIGPEAFVEKIRKRYQEAAGGRVRPEDAVLRAEKRLWTAGEVREAVKKVTGLDDTGLSKRKIAAPQRALLSLALQQYAGLTQREITEHLDVGSGAAVCALVQRHAGDPEVRKWKGELELIFKG